MKNLIFLFVVLFTFQNAKAQFQIGVETNSSWSNMNIQGDGNLLSNPKLYNGIKTGISVAYPIYAGLGIESGLYYHRTGFKVSQALDFDVYNFPIKAGVTAIPQFHYLETPLLLNYTFGEKMKIPIQNCAIKFNGQFQHGLNDLSDEPILNIQTRRYAIGLGAGVSYTF